MIMLIDQDDVMVNFKAEILNTWNKRNPNEKPLLFEDMTTYYTGDQFPEFKEELLAIQHEKGFYLRLTPLKGAIEAIKKIAKLHYTFICTTPLENSKYCVSEKRKWTEKYLGREWLKRCIINHDKTPVIGDYLIDDKPDITGIVIPSWEQIVYDQPYNRHIKDKKRINWNNWEKILLPLL